MPGIATGFPFGARGATLPSRPSYDVSTKTASGRAPAGATVAVRVDGAAAATVPADAQGRWSHVFATAPGNGQTITASAEVVSPGLTVAVAVPAEPLGPTTAAFAAGAPAGTLIAAITGLASDETIASFTPDDGRLALDSGRRTLLAGLSAAAAGTIAATLTTSAGRSLAMTITVNAVSSEPPVPVYGLVTATKDGSTGQTYTLNAPWSDVQWYRMALASPFGLTAIAGATGPSYVAQAADQGSRLVAVGIDAGTSRAAKALHVVYEPPVVIEPFESLSGFTASNGAQLALVSDAPAYGASRLRVASSGQNLASASKNLGLFDPSLLGTIAFQGDLGMDEARQSGGVRVNLRRASVEQVSGGLTTTGTNYETPSPLHIGRRWGAYHVSEIPGLARTGANAMGVVVGPTGSIPWSMEAKFDALLGKAGGRATVILGFDDNILTQYQNAFPAMEARGMKGIFYLPSQSPQNPSYMTLAMLKEMYAAGWDCGLDSTHDDSISSSFGTMAAWEASFQQNRDYALANGMTRGNEHICYTHGQIETNPPSNRVMVSAVTGDGSDVVTLGGTSTGYPSGTTVAVGMRAVGDGVPNSPVTTVTEVLSATQVRLSAAVPAQTKAMLFVDTSPEFYTMKLPRRVAALGVRTARTTKNQGGYLTRFGLGDAGMFTFANALHNTSLAQFKVLVDRAILCGLTIEFYTHGIQNGAPTGSSELSDFIAKLDYLKEKMDAGLLDVLPWSQVWQRDGNAGVPANLQSPPAGAPSAISFIGATANNNVPSIPSGQQAGDLLLAFAYRDGNTTPPTLPAGWTELASAGANNQAFILAWKLSAGASETAPTFSSATNTVLHCYRGMSAASPIGAVSPVATGASGNATVPASGWSLQKGDNTSWVAYFGGSRAASSSIDTDANRVGHTNANSTSDAGGSDTLGPVSATDTYVPGFSGGQSWYAIAVEIKA